VSTNAQAPSASVERTRKIGYYTAHEKNGGPVPCIFFRRTHSKIVLETALSMKNFAEFGTKTKRVTAMAWNALFALTVT
jgi:hypothetical protein